jgi:hypothetical protein
MPVKQIVFLMTIFVCLTLWILKMIIKRQLREAYAVLWMFVVLCIPASILFYPFLLKIVDFVGFIAPINFSFVVGFVVLFVICLHFSAMNSAIHHTLKNTVQKMALLEEEIKQLKLDKEKKKSQKKK